jgi:hypothetical protein
MPCPQLDESASPGPPAEIEPSESPGDCVICFETIACVASLPCDCRVPYCNTCWDRCLAQSLRTSHRARCPTCRTPVHVDFDETKGQLVFSREPETLGEVVSQPSAHETPPSSPGAARGPTSDSSLGVSSEEQPDPAPEPEEGWVGEDGVWYCAAEWATWERERALAWEAWQRERGLAQSTMERLAEQTRPAQLELLRRWGRESIGAGGTTEERLATQEGSGVGPKCVCGGVLQRCTNEGYCPCCSCDLCGESLTASPHVWACENKSHTILHVFGRDICESCFLHHTGILGKGGQ